MPENSKIYCSERRFAFDIWDDATKKAAFDFAEGYKKFLSFAKTERLAVDKAKESAQKYGFKGDRACRSKHKTRLQMGRFIRLTAARRSFGPNRQAP